jgi:hypothetical protein
LVFRLFVPADDLFTDAEPARKFSLRHSLSNSGNARSSVESNDSRVTHSTTPF